MTMTELSRRTRSNSGRAYLRVTWIALLMVLMSSGRVEAQFGFGGYGYGFLHPYTPPSVRTLDRIAVTRAGMDQEALNQTKLTTPDRFSYRRQQVSMQQRADINTMTGIDVDRRGRGIPLPNTQVAATGPGAIGQPRPGDPVVPRPQLSIESFVNDDNKVVWPADAPISGDLGQHRDQADEAIAEVVQEDRAMGYARVATVANARQELLNYGQPALKFVRENSTARVADAFHLFLLSLYDALAQAAERDPSAGPSNPPPDYR